MEFLPDGTSVGQLALLQSGAQKSPARPVTLVHVVGGLFQAFVVIATNLHCSFIRLTSTSRVTVVSRVSATGSSKREDGGEQFHVQIVQIVRIPGIEKPYQHDAFLPARLKIPFGLIYSVGREGMTESASTDHQHSGYFCVSKVPKKSVLLYARSFADFSRQQASEELRS
jgi:hypothetical protein